MLNIPSSLSACATPVMPSSPCDASLAAKCQSEEDKEDKEDRERTGVSQWGPGRWILAGHRDTSPVLQ